MKYHKNYLYICNNITSLFTFLISFLKIVWIFISLAFSYALLVKHRFTNCIDIITYLDFIVCNPSSIQYLNNNNSNIFNLYSYPCSGYFFIYLFSIPSIVNIYSSDGFLLYHNEVFLTSNLINLDGIISAFYIVEIITQNSVIYRKLLI
jgi:hypothetical protein